MFAFLWPLFAVAAAALVPLLVSMWRQRAVRGRRDAALMLHRAQMVELDRDLADGRIAPAEHASAQLEVQRRLLAAAATPDIAPSRASRTPLVLSLVAIPVLAFALYRIGGRPDLPAAPMSERLAEMRAGRGDEAMMVERLRQAIAGLNPLSEEARRGYVLLGNIQDRLGDLPEAAQAWRTAVTIRFEPGLAARAAEAQTELEHAVSPDSAALFRRALAESPPNAPWRPLAERRLAELP